MTLSSFFKLGMALSFSAFFLDVFGQEDTTVALAEIEQHRQEKFHTFKGDNSPLARKERRRFKGLKYYPVDLNYRVKARFIKTANPVLFKMKTTTTRLPDYSKYGEVHFTLQGQAYSLEVYQNPELMKREGYADYLFIPFTDETNGKETYEVGRYLEMRIPSTEEVIIDFNLCYSPYCSYSPNYSCPIPPEANHLPLAIKAGEKKYKGH